MSCFIIELPTMNRGNKISKVIKANKDIDHKISNYSKHIRTIITCVETSYNKRKIQINLNLPFNNQQEHNHNVFVFFFFGTD